MRALRGPTVSAPDPQAPRRELTQPGRVLAALQSSLEEAFAWLCRQRRYWPDDTDVWEFRRSWPAEKRAILRDLRSDRYRFSLLTKVATASGETAHVWAARDAAVLKALTIALGSVLPVSTRCAHVKGHGGLKGAVRDAVQALPEHRFVFRTDVKSYYDSIDPGALIERLKRHIGDERIVGLVRQYLYRTSERGGVFTTFEKGISRGCPLSPLMGAFFLGDLDARMERQAARDRLFYVRYMDDILVLAPTRWKLRRAVGTINAELASLGLEQHPGKTFVGRISRGFDFLGHHLSHDGVGKVRLGLAANTVASFKTKLSRLYEQGRSAKATPSGRRALEARMSIYIRRWCSRVRGGGLWDGTASQPSANNRTGDRGARVAVE